jgi:hypothetical protein
MELVRRADVTGAPTQITRRMDPGVREDDGFGANENGNSAS